MTRAGWCCMTDGFMSTTEPLDDETMTEPWDDLAASAAHALAPQAPTTIVPSGSISGRSLSSVIAIMTFLAALTAGAVTMMVGTASDWESDVGREVTIQVRPASGRDIEADVRTAVTLAHPTPASATCEPIPGRSRQNLSSLGSAPALRSTTCRSRA